MDEYCSNKDEEICHRFNPAKASSICLRCGHQKGCHEELKYIPKICAMFEPDDWGMPMKF